MKYLRACLLSIIVVGCATTPHKESAVINPEKSSVVEEKMVMATNQLHKAPDKAATQTVDAADANSTQDASQINWGDPLSGEYRIEAGDTLMFRSFDDPTLDEQVVVRYDGNISLPLVPDINVNLATREEAEQKIKKAYSKVFIDPQVSLSIVSSTSKFFQVMGEVQRPDRYPYERRMTLLDAINTAGGPRINQRSGDTFVGAQGALSKALIIRRSPQGRRVVLDYDLHGLSEPGPHASDAPFIQAT